MGVMGKVSGSVGWEDPAARSLHPPGLTSLPAALFLSIPKKRMGLRRGGGREIPSLSSFEIAYPLHWNPGFGAQ